MSDSLETHSVSSSVSIDVSSSNDEVSMHSTISGDSQLDDHRNQEMSMPIRHASFMASQDQVHTQNQQEAFSVPDAALHTAKNGEKGSKRNELQHTENIPEESSFVSSQTKKYKRSNSHDSAQEIGPLSSLHTDRPHSKFDSKFNSRDLLNKMVIDDDYDEYAAKFNDRYNSNTNKGSGGINFALNDNTPAPLKLNEPQQPQQAHQRRKSKSRSKSFSEQVKSFIRPKEESVTAGGILLSEGGGILSGSHANHEKEVIDGDRFSLLTNEEHPQMTKVISRASSRSTRRKVAINAPNVNTNDIDSDLDSHASRESQETEEDVCFPMLPEHIRIRGIDFDEIEEFITEQREENQKISMREKELRLGSHNSITTSSEKNSSAALKYMPKNIHGSSSSDTSYKTEDQNVPVDSARMAHSNAHHNFSSAYDYNNNNYNNNMGYNENVTFVPNNVHEDDELPTRFSFFQSENEETIHAADIPSLVEPGQSFKKLFEPEESVWWLDCTCPTDSEMKMLAKAFGIHPLTAEDIRMQETREKVELFKSYYFVSFHTFETDIESEDFLEPINVYLVVFRSGILTFHFSPIINPANVRRRVRQLRDYVNVSADWLCYAMIDDITDGFAPIIQSIEHEADAIEDSVFLSRDNDFGKMLLKIGESRRKVMTLMRLLQGKADVIKMFAKRCQDEANNKNSDNKTPAQPRGDIALYLGDIQDHIITMFQSLLSYEKIFSRSHSNYLAQLQVESFYSNVKVTDMLSKVTLLGTILVPMNLVTGLFGMNVKVPGDQQSNYGWFGGIVGFIFLTIVISGLGAHYYFKNIEETAGRESVLTSGLSLKSFRIGRRKNKQHDLENQLGAVNDSHNPHSNNNILSFINGGKKGNKNDAISLPTRFTRYGDW